VQIVEWLTFAITMMKMEIMKAKQRPVEPEGLLIVFLKKKLPALKACIAQKRFLKPGKSETNHKAAA
jgi:hypothetical protein